MLKKIISVLVLISFAVSFTLPARNRTYGARVRVTMINGSTITGELYAIDREQITINWEKTEYLMTNPMAKVASILLIRTAGKKGGGALWGALLGGLTGFVIGAQVKSKGFINTNPFLFGLVGLPTGAVMALIFSSRRGKRVNRNFPIQGQSEETLAWAIYDLKVQAADSRNP